MGVAWERQRKQKHHGLEFIKYMPELSEIQVNTKQKRCMMNMKLISSIACTVLIIFLSPRDSLAWEIKAHCENGKQLEWIRKGVEGTISDWTIGTTSTIRYGEESYEITLVKKNGDGTAWHSYSSPIALYTGGVVTIWDRGSEEICRYN